MHSLELIRIAAETVSQASRWQPRLIRQLEQARIHPHFRKELLIDVLVQSTNILMGQKERYHRKQLQAIRKLTATAMYADEHTLQTIVGLMCLLTQSTTHRSHLRFSCASKQEQLS